MDTYWECETLHDIKWCIEESSDDHSKSGPHCFCVAFSFDLDTAHLNNRQEAGPLTHPDQKSPRT